VALDVQTATAQPREDDHLAPGDSAGFVDGSDTARSGVQARRPAARVSVAVGLVTVCALSALVGWLGYRAHESRQANTQRQQFIQVARQAAVDLTTISHARPDADVQRILNSATGAFHDQFQQRSAVFIDVVKKAQTTSEGTVTEAGLESESADRGRVVVAVNVKTSSAGVAEPSPRAWRMRIDVQKVGADAKVSNVEFVP
jgi:Mce-associated membrane protein